MNYSKKDMRKHRNFRCFLLIFLLFCQYLTTAQITTYPYHLGFESNPSVDWSPLATGADCSTNWYTTATPANTITGAAIAHKGTKYLTTSYTGCSQMNKIVVSPIYDFTGLTAPTFSFYFHMYGADMGSLTLEVSDNGGTSWSAPILQLNSQQQSAASDPWLQEEVDLSTYAGQSIMLRFKATNEGELSAFSLDQFRVFDADNDIINGQADVFFEYDEAGNRVRRYYEVIDMAQSEDDPPAQMRSTSTEDDADLTYRVYPNPTTYRIHVESADATETSMVRLLDFNGRELRVLQMVEGFVQLDMSTLQVGTYFISIENEERVVTKKVIKQ